MLDRALVQSLSHRTDATVLDSRQCLAEVARLLDSLKIEADFDAQIVSEIECQTPRSSTEALDAPIRAHLRDNPECSLAALACWGLRHAGAMSDPIREGGFDTDTHSVLHTLWRYIQHQPHGDTRDKLLDMMILQLADIGVNPVCNTDCVQRLLMDAGAIDTTLVSHEPSDQVMQDLIQQIALRVTSSFDDDYSGACDDVPNDPEKVIALKQDVTRASVIDDLVRRRGWRRDRVEALLAPIIDQIKYL
ncbi:MAG: hypothetical protein H7315_09045 [Herminiimonas sp.]|nr:hypothetical protein [Herminiimonas sp.]